MNASKTPRQSCDFSALGNALGKLNDGQAIEDVIQGCCPRLLEQIRQDAARPALLRLWGKSLNVDENTGTTIVAEPVITQLSHLAGVAHEGAICHAGVLHTYGYLLSTLATPYGYKRERWVKGEIESLAGLPGQTLRACPSMGTLLSNATYFFGRVAFRGQPKEIAALRRQRTAVASCLPEFRYNRLRWTRITETVHLSRKQSVNLHTDLLPSRMPEDSRNLLIYSIESQQDTKAVRRCALITAFPISAEATNELLAPERFGRRQEIRARFNAFVPDLSGRVVTGERVRFSCTSAGMVRSSN